MARLQPGNTNADKCPTIENANFADFNLSSRINQSKCEEHWETVVPVMHLRWDRDGPWPCVLQGMRGYHEVQGRDKSHLVPCPASARPDAAPVGRPSLTAPRAEALIRTANGQMAHCRADPAWVWVAPCPPKSRRDHSMMSRQPACCSDKCFFEGSPPARTQEVGGQGRAGVASSHRSGCQ